MNFFQQQENARVKTRWLIFIYLLAVGAIIISLDAVFLALKTTLDSERTLSTGLQSLLSSETGNLVILSVVIVIFIGLASLYRVMSLSGGGARVATLLGGTHVDRRHPDRKVKILLNVAEEMAISSGVPVPQVYVLEQEAGINAFAAGHQPEDAVIAVTRGALDTFDRDELQGVIGHEFSHILNGDMRLNMRLLGPIFGISLIGMIGRILLRSNRRVRVSSNKGSSGVAVILLVGASLAVIGFVGQLAARMIKAAISRQREFLADASAVQFTRQKQGIGSALKKIAAWQYGSELNDLGAEEVSHMLFANGLQQHFSGVFATHPPITDRLARIGMRFEKGELSRLADEMKHTVDDRENPVRNMSVGEEFSGLAEAGTARSVTAATDLPGDESLHDARLVIDHIPEKIRCDCESTTTVREVVVALALASEVSAKRRQLEIIRDSASGINEAQVLIVREIMDTRNPGLRLPVLDLAFPVLRRLTYQQQLELYQLLESIIPLDGEVSSFEYMLSRLMQQMLVENHRPSRFSGKRRLKLSSLVYQFRTLFSVVAIFGHDDIEPARRAYNAGMENLFGSQAWPEFYLPKEWTSHFDAALADIDRARPLVKEEVINSLKRTIEFDAHLRIEEYELLRVISALLHCPMPLLEGAGQWYIDS